MYRLCVSVRLAGRKSSLLETGLGGVLQKSAARRVQMKLMIASDIHGDAAWCSRLVETFRMEQCEKLVLLGDLLYHGPRNPIPTHYDPKGVVALLNPLKERILCVRGNCDAEVDQMLLEFPIMADYAQILTPRHCFYLTHGHHYSMENLPPLGTGAVFAQGHTHIPVLRQQEGLILVNPGSVSLPKNNSPHSFCLYEENGDEAVFCLKDLDGRTFAKLDG